MRIPVAVIGAVLLVVTSSPTARAADVPVPSEPTPTTAAPSTTVPTADPPTTSDDPAADPGTPPTDTDTDTDDTGDADTGDDGGGGGGGGAAAATVDLSLGRSRFSPNADGRADDLPVQVTATEAATMTVTVERDGATLAVLARDRAVGPGTTDLTWNGRDTAGRVTTDGWVFVRLEATPASGPSIEQVRSSVIDTRPPSFAWRRIAPSVLTGSGPLQLSFATGREKGTVAIRFEMISLSGSRARRPAVRIPVGANTQSWAPRRSGNRLLIPGHYLLAAVVADSVGNVSTSPVRTVRVHRSVTTIPLRRLSAAGNRVALTFDDCNDTGAWSRIVQIMRQNFAGATYFCIGQNVARYPALARQTAGQWGNSIGSHSPNHDDMTRFGSFTVAGMLSRDRDTWWAAARTTPTPYFRPPYGSYNSSVLAGAGAAGYRYTVLWDVDPRDWERPGSGAIAQRVLSRVRGGSIVVMHTLPQTAAALPTILAGLRQRGLRPVSMAEMTHAAHI